MHILGLDPGLQRTGWGIIRFDGTRLQFCGAGLVTSHQKDSLAERLSELHQGICEVISQWDIQAAAVEQVFVNKNPESTLKLGQARGVVMLAPALAGIPVMEYASTKVKKTLVGVGRADKEQVGMMVRTLLPNCRETAPDITDALAVAICHAHHS